MTMPAGFFTPSSSPASWTIPSKKASLMCERGLDIAQHLEEKSIVLLKNDNAVLPLNAAKIRSIAVIGGHADVGMISGGGSAQVDPPGGNAISPPGKGATHWQDHIWFPTSPLKALRAKLPNAKIEFNSGQDLAAAAALAKSADVAIVFAYQWEAEGMDLSNPRTSRQSGRADRAGRGRESTYDCRSRDRHRRDHALDREGRGVVEAWYAGSAATRPSPTC